MKHKIQLEVKKAPRHFNTNPGNFTVAIEGDLFVERYKGMRISLYKNNVFLTDKSQQEYEMLYQLFKQEQYEKGIIVDITYEFIETLGDTGWRQITEDIFIHKSNQKLEGHDPSQSLIKEFMVPSTIQPNIHYTPLVGGEQTNLFNLNKILKNK